MFDQIAQLRIVQSILEGMGQHRHAPRAPDDPDGALKREEMPRLVVAPPLFHKAVKGVLHVPGQAEFH